MALVPYIAKGDSTCTDLVPVEAPQSAAIKRSNSLPGSSSSRRVQPSQNPRAEKKALALPSSEPVAPPKPAPSRPFDMDRLKALSQPKAVVADGTSDESQMQVAIIKKKQQPNTKPPIIPGTNAASGG